MVKISVALRFRIPFYLKECLTAGFELITSNYQSLKRSYHLIDRGRLGKSENHLSYGLKRCGYKKILARNGWTVADFSVIMVAVDLSDEHHFQLYRDDRQKRVRRRPGQHADPAFTITRLTGPQPGVTVWGVISFDRWTSLCVIRVTFTAQRYVDDILRTVLLPFLLQYPGLIFSKIMSDFILHACYYELSYSLSNTPLANQIARYLSNRACLGYERRILHLSGHVDDLARQLEQTWQEITQKIIRERYHSMPRRVEGGVQSRGGSTSH
ncbi:transposable element Tc1 transposase [Trichonephila clavipes]|nr:transposable element Tc1 transposase [Trichonephila clavipes]